MKIVKLLGGVAHLLYSQERGVNDVPFRTEYRFKSLLRLLSISYSLYPLAESNRLFLE